MPTLILFRHAKSDWSSPARGDHERALNSRGQRDAPAMGQWFADNGLAPDRVLCSTSARTRETLERASQRWPHQPDAVFLDTLYNAGTTELLAAIRAHGEDAATLMILAHNPGIAELTLALLPAGKRPAALAKIGKFPTAAAAIITLSSTNWREIAKVAGHLEHFQMPRDLT